MEIVWLRSELKNFIVGSRGARATVPHSWRHQYPSDVALDKINGEFNLSSVDNFIIILNSEVGLC